MTKPTGRLSANMLKVGGRRPLTKRPALAMGQDAQSPNHALIQQMLAQAREEIGYHRSDFIRVPHPDEMVPGTLMGRYREHIPPLDRTKD